MPQGYNLHFSIKGWEFLHQFLANFSPKKFRFSIAFFRRILYNNQCSPRKGGHCAGVLELVDEEDSKSFGLIPRAGSIPATGTIFAPKCHASEHFLLLRSKTLNIFRKRRKNCICRRDLTGKIQMCVILFPD